MNKKVKLSLLLIAILILSIFPLASSYKFPVESQKGLVPAVGDLDYDSMSEFVLMSDGGDLIIINSETLKDFYAALSSNWTPLGELFVNEKNEIFYAFKIPFGEDSSVSPFLFDANKDGIEDIIIAFTKTGKVEAIDYFKLSTDLLDKKTDIKINDYIIWTNTLSNDEITSGMSLFQEGSKYYIAMGTADEKIMLVDVFSGNFEEIIDLSGFSLIPERRGIYNAPLVFDVNNDYVKDIIVGANSGTVTAISGASMHRLWSYSKKNSPILFSPSVVKGASGNILVIPFKEYKIVGVNAVNGKEIWFFNTENPILGAATVSDVNKDGVEEVIFATHSGVINCLNGETGKKLWSIATSKISATPTIFDFNKDLYGDIIIANDNGIIEVFNSKTKSLLQGYKFVTKGTQQITGQPFVGDFDGDGVIDIAVTSTDGYFYTFTDPNKIETEHAQLFCAHEKGDPYRTGNVMENSKNIAKLTYYLNEIRKKNFYETATDYLQQNNINNAALYFKKVIDIDPDYKDTSDQFAKIIGNFLAISYESFNNAIKNDDMAEAKKILLEVETTSAEYENLSAMRESLKKKQDDYEEAQTLFNNGKLALAGNRIVEGYEMLEKAHELNSTNKNIEKEMKKYSYEMQLYRDMQSSVSSGEWGRAKEYWNKLYQKNPKFPGLSGIKNRIFINANLLFIILGAVALVALIIFLVIFMKSQKKKKEALMQQQIIEDKDEFSSDSMAFSGDDDDDDQGHETDLSVEQMQEGGIGLDTGDVGGQETSAGEYEDNTLEAEEDANYELGGIDLGVEPTEAEEAPIPMQGLDDGTVTGMDDDEDHGIPGEDLEGVSEFDAGYAEPTDGAWGMENTLDPEDVPETDMAEENLEVRMTMAVQLYEEERYDEAAEEFSTILDKQSPFQYKAMAYSGFCYYALGDTERSMKLIKNIPYQNEEIPKEERKEILQILGEGFMKVGLVKPAMQAYKRLLELSEGLDKKNILYKLGELEFDSGNKESATKYFKELFLMDPNYKDVGDKLDELGFS